MEKKNTIIEYCFLSIILIGMLDSLFVGFSSLRYRWIIIFGAIGIFVFLQGVFLIHRNVFLGYVILLLVLLVTMRTIILNGFYLVYNRIMEQINDMFDMGFFYYVDVSIENFYRDSILFLIFVILLLNIILYLCKNRLRFLIFMTCIFEMIILVLAPYQITSSFFLFLLGVFGYEMYHKRRYMTCLLGCVFFLGVSLLVIQKQGERIYHLSAAKEQAIETVRNVAQGDNYVVSGGIGEGDMRNAQRVSPKGITLFIVETVSDRTLYLKGFVSGHYEDNHWERDQRDVHIIEGNNAISLPFNYFDLHMSEFVAPKLEETLVEDEDDMKLQYQKLNDTYFLWPYFSDLETNQGKVFGDSYMTRANLNPNLTFGYYPIKSIDAFLKLGNIEFHNVETGTIEDNYESSMESYNIEVEREYLEISKKLEKQINQKFPQLKKQKSLTQKVSCVQNILKSQYKYSFFQEQVPKGEDSIWYFLNKAKKGYCVQYASSAVMMFRSMGIPSRYVEGYKIDQSYLKKSDRVKVTDAFAHAWPEIYLNHIGWVPIEVTNVTRATTRVDSDMTGEIQGKTSMDARKILTTLQDVKNVIVIGVIVLFFVQLLNNVIFAIRWKHKNNKEKVQWYYEMLSNQYPLEMAKIKDSKVKKIFMKAKYSPYEIKREELNIVKRYMNILRK